MQIFNKIKDTIKHEIHGYKIVAKLTDEEHEKFKDLYLDWNIWIRGLSDPMENPGSHDAFRGIAETNKKPLDEFVDSLHIKYGTDKTKHGILSGYITEREKQND